MSIVFDEYYGESKERKIARLLWLWYDYHTEQYDRMSPYVEGRYGEAMILDSTYRSMSNANAGNQLRYIWGIAIQNSVLSKDMNAAKNDSYRSIKLELMFEEYQQMIVREEDFLTEIGLLIK